MSDSTSNNETPNKKASDLTANDIQIIVAENLANIRSFNGLSQVDMSDKIKTYQAAYTLSERGNRELNFVNLYYLAVELGVNLNWLFGLSDNRLNTSSRVKHIENLTKKDKRRRMFTKKKISGGKNGGQ